VGEPQHRPVMVRELLELLGLKRGLVVLDCTVGLGGHAEEVLRRISPGGRLIGIDCDEEAVKVARERLERWRECVFLFHANFTEAARVLDEVGVKGVGAMYFDLGVSSMQLEAAGRGFSFRSDGPLDMRMDRSVGVTAADLLKRMSEADLERVIKEYGEERWARRIARAVVEARKRGPIRSTGELGEIVSRAVKRRPRKIHPATRTFQALRIAVNEELGNLSRGLEEADGLVEPGGSLAAISFHSLEDRIVKRDFKGKEKAGRWRVITKKPVRPSEEEVRSNPRARSAKLRAVRSGGENA